MNHVYYWQEGDWLSTVCNFYFPDSNWPDVQDFREAVLAAAENATIWDWLHIPVGTPVLLPYNIMLGG